MAYYKFCEQCGKMYMAQRDSARFCTTACRMRAHRGSPPKPHYETKRDHAEQVLRTIAENSPIAFQRLKELKERHGMWALLTAIDAVEEIVKQSKPKPKKGK